MKKIHRRLGYALGALLLLVVVALAIAPRLIDAPAVHAEIQRRLSEALAGQVAWKSLEVRLLPVPHAELRELRIDIPGTANVAAELLDVRLRVWPLLRGRTEIASLVLRGPRIQVAAGEGGKDEPPADAMATYRAVVEPLARSLKEFASSTTLDVNDAALEVRSPDAAPFVLRSVRIRARGGTSGLDLQLEAANELWKGLKVEGHLDYGDLSAKLVAHLDDLDLPALSRLAGLGRIGRLEGRASATATAVVDKAWRADVDITRSSATLQLAALPWPLAVQDGRAELTEKNVHVRGARGTLGESSFQDVAAHIELEGKPRLSAASGRAKLPLEQWFPWLAEKFPLETVSALSGSLDLTLKRLALPFDRPQAIELEALVVPRAASATLSMLPGPVAIDGGAVSVDAAAVRLDKVPVALLDAKGLVSGTIALRRPKVDLSLAEAGAGDRLVRWALDLSGAPAHIEPKTPVRLAARRIAWEAAGLDVDAGLEFAGGPRIGIAVGWAPKQLEVRRLSIKDARSDATLTASVRGNVLEAGFSGLLYGETLAAMQHKAGVRAGSMQGDLRLTLDRERPGRTTADGNLRVERLDLAWLTGRPVQIERASLSADKASLRITQTRLNVDEQILELSGEARNTEQGPVVDARLESPGVVLSRLVPPSEKPAPEGRESKLWPLPMTGRIAVRAGFLQLQPDHRIAPLEGSVDLKPESARLDVKQARMCGLSFPLQAEATPKGNNVAVQITMQDEPFADAIRCLTGDTVEITGNADLRADVSSRGAKRDEILRNLVGTAQMELRKGRVERFALLGNILSVRSIASARQVRESGFPYRSMTAKGHFEGGAFMVEEALFDSDALRLVVDGKVDLQGAHSNLTVLVGLLTSVDRITGEIPILGNVFGGSLLGIPVAVTGDIRDPLVVPLDPRAITGRLLGVFERAFKLPGKLGVPNSGGNEPAPGEGR